MHMQQRVQLPDHGFGVARKHKLIPFVYAAVQIDSASVIYSGPMYSAIWSWKHNNSNASIDSWDFDTLFNIEEFDEVMKAGDGQLKPVVIITVDGGPGENPR